MSPRTRGMTLIEVVVATAVVGVGACLVGTMQPQEHARAVARQVKDATQLRGIHQGMVVFGSNNNDKHPLPSTLDLAGHTVDVGQVADPTLAPLADSTRNIMSILLYQGFVPVEMFISPAEASEHLSVYQDYQFDRPPGAPRPELALWDPAFRATPEDTAVSGRGEGTPGGFSYAHAIPLGGRAAMWGNTFVATQAALANRGPSFDFVGEPATGTWNLVDDGNADNAGFDAAMGTSSVTLAIHGQDDRWEGNVVVQDNSTRYVTDPALSDMLFRFEGLAVPGVRTTPLPDNLFAREHDRDRLPGEQHLWNTQTFGAQGEDTRNNYLRSYAGGPGAMLAEGTPEARQFLIDIFLD